MAGRVDGRSIVTEFLEALDGVAADNGVRERLALFAERLLARRATLNVTGARDAAAISAHVVDSLAIRQFVAESHVDIGSGGGFPAVPLAIVTGYRMTLVESMAKKAAFLRELVAELQLAVDVRSERAEETGRLPALRESFATATARAVGSVPLVLELTLPLLAVGGVAILQRGRFDDAERRATADALMVLDGELVEERLCGTGGDERRILLVRKRKSTNQRFPRRAGIPAKRPLCLSDG